MQRAGAPLRVHGMVEDIVGCKWSLSVLALVRDGVKRPGAMQKSVSGLSTKVLNERLRKLQRFGIVQKSVYAEIPPRVEYDLTAFGEQFLRILDDIDSVQKWLERAPRETPRQPHRTVTPSTGARGNT